MLPLSRRSYAAVHDDYHSRPLLPVVKINGIQAVHFEVGQQDEASHATNKFHAKERLEAAPERPDASETHFEICQPG